MNSPSPQRINPERREFLGGLARLRVLVPIGVLVHPDESSVGRIFRCWLFLFVVHPVLCAFCPPGLLRYFLPGPERPCPATARPAISTGRFRIRCSPWPKLRHNLGMRTAYACRPLCKRKGRRGLRCQTAHLGMVDRLHLGDCLPTLSNASRTIASNFTISSSVSRVKWLFLLFLERVPPFSCTKVMK